ncbi:hypothetical protein BDY17DRAFT_301952 [Neohortaea acidophila]|uniref:Secreted protein n=1 Tax=Neohortaea acidophila TaxID=245834 RepID=A0A6A6PKJ9_9PEZI|nr:uncharacterized protein BDY17DRAFT_301952 [Neohortaea acidophila]KAF2480532.1 hypothetical protein BDY17DRAFT_301952 [Neohortaea acidophila]
MKRSGRASALWCLVRRGLCSVPFVSLSAYEAIAASSRNRLSSPMTSSFGSRIASASFVSSLPILATSQNADSRRMTRPSARAA